MMCCCCFARHGCLYCWFVFTTVFAFLMLLIVAGIVIAVDIINAEAIVLIFSTITTMIVCIVAVVMLIKQWQHLVPYIAILLLLLFTVCCSLAILASLFPAGGITIESFVKYYAVNYAKTHDGEAPELLIKVQNLVPCCGGSGFRDYVLHPPINESGKDKFTVPDSCCTKFGTSKPGKGCGSGANLNITTYNNSIWLQDKLNKFLKPALETEVTIEGIFSHLQKEFTSEIQKFADETINSVLNDGLLKVDRTTGRIQTPVIIKKSDELPSVINNFVQDYINEVIANTTDPRKVEDNFRDGAKAKVDSLKNVKMEDILPVNVYGCGTLLGMAKNIKYLNKDKENLQKVEFMDTAFRALIGVIRGFVSIYAILTVLCLVLFNYCYWKISRPQAQSEVAPDAYGDYSGGGTGTENYSSSPYSPSYIQQDTQQQYY